MTKCKNCPEEVTGVRLLFYKEIKYKTLSGEPLSTFDMAKGLPVADLVLNSRPVADLCRNCFDALQKAELSKSALGSASGETPFQKYKRYELALKYLRAGMKEDDPEDMGLYEDDILDLMDKAWHQLTDEERAILNAEGPQTWLL